MRRSIAPKTSSAGAGAERPYPGVQRTGMLIGDVLERLSAEDRLILWPDEVWPQDIGAEGVLEGSSLLESVGRFRIEVAKQAGRRSAAAPCLPTASPAWQKPR